MQDAIHRLADRHLDAVMTGQRARGDRRSDALRDVSQFGQDRLHMQDADAGDGCEVNTENTVLPLLVGLRL